MKIVTSFFTIAKSKLSDCRFFFVALLLSTVVSTNVSAQTITFTGATADFTGQGISALAAGSGDVTYYASTDGTYMYLGAFRTAGAVWGSTDHFTFYVDADPRSAPTTAGNGSTTGLAWDNQTPTMPFRADYRVAIRTDGNTGSGQGSSFYSSNNTTSGTANWATGGANAKGYSQYVSNAANGGIEIRVPLSDFGNPASVYLSMFASYSGAGGGFFGPATGTFTGSTLSGYLRNLGVYKTTGNLTAGAITTPITNISLSASGTITAGDYGDITLNAATTNTLGGNTSFSGTLTVATSAVAQRVGLSTFTLYVGGRGFGGTAGQILINGTSGAPFTASAGGTVNFLGAGLLGGTTTATSFVAFPAASAVIINGAVDFGNVGATTPSGLAGTLQINTGGSVNTNPPTYNSGSSLIYNTGGTYTAGAEWTTNSASVKGVPQAVTLQNNTALNFGSSATYRQANGLVTIGSGSSLTLSSASGGDLKINAGLTNSNSGVGIGVNTNGRAIFVVGNGTYTKNSTTGGTDSIDILIFNTNQTLTLANNTNLNLTNTTASGCLQFGSSSGSSVAMAGTNTLSIGAGCTVIASSTASITGSSATTSILSFAGAATIGSTAVLTAGTTVGTQLNGALSITNAGKFIAGDLQINQGGSVTTNVMTYTASGNLRYNHSSGTYGVFNEWPSASGPTNVFVNANGSSTGISFANNNIAARTLAGTLTINQDVDLSGSGPAALTTLNMVANVTATVKGIGNYTQSASGSFTTANTGGVNGTLTTSGTVNLPTTTSFTFNNATTSQVTGALLPATVAALTINNPTVSTGTTISNNALTITGLTTLTAGALVLPTGAGNLVTFTGNISTPTGGGTITGSTTSNISTGGTIAGTANGLSFTSGSANIRNWTHTTTTNFGSTSAGINSALNIYGVFSTTATSPFIYIGSSGAITFTSGSSFIDNGTSIGTAFLQTTATGGSFTLQSGSTFTTANTSGLNATSASGAVQTTNRSFSGGANYTFANTTTAQNIGDALDGAGGTGKTGAITGNVVLNNSASSGVILNSGTTITVNTPGTFTLGTGTSSGTMTASATSVINGTGAFIMLGNGATSGSTLITQHASGVSGTVQTTGSNSLTNGANNNTNFSFTGSVAQTTGSLLPAIVNNLNFTNIFSGSVASPSVTLSSSVTVNGTTTMAGGTAPLGLIGIGSGNTLTLNGVVTMTNANKLVGTTTSNLIIGGSGAMGTTIFAAGGGGVINNFTMNRTGVTATIGTTLTVSGTFSLTAGVLAMSNNTLTLNGPIAFGTGNLTATGPLTIGGSGSITGSLTSTSNPLSLTTFTINRSGATLPLGSNVSVSTALVLTAGNISLGSFNLTSTSTGGLGTGSTSSMIVATGSGQAFNTIPTSSFVAQTWPVGDGTNYTPVILTFSVNGTSGTVGVKLTASVHPNISSGSTPAVYISRYWTFTNTIAATYSYSGTFRYISPDDVVTGTELDLKLSRWNSTIWTEFAGSSVSSPVLSSGSLTQTTGPLTATNDYTGRANSSAINYTWNGVTNDWNTGTNWSPNGVPTAVDNVTIDGSLSGVLCSINSGSFSVNNFTLNGSGNFAMASGTTLAVNGTMTYGGSATATLDCASNFNYAGLASQTVAALNYGNLNLAGAARVLASSGTIGVCGTFTPGAGGFTVTGSTVEFYGSSSQTIPVFNYNNLTSSSTGLRILASGTIGVDGVFTPGSNSYTVTGNTINFSNSGSQTIPAFNYNSITNTGNGARILANSGTVAISSSFTPGSGAYTVNGSTVDYNGTTGFTMSTFTYNNLIISGNKGAGTVSFGTGTITIGGTLTYSATNSTQSAGTSTVIFNGTGAQTIPALNYSALTISGSRGANNVTLANSGTISIAGTFTPSATFTAGNGYVNTGSTVVISATNTIPLLTLPTGQTAHFNNLTLSSGTATAAGSLVIGGNLTVSGATYNVTSAANAYATTVNGNLNLSSGTIDWAPSGTTVAGTINLKGNLNHTGVVTNTANTAAVTLGGFVFNGNGTSVSPQTISLANRLNSTSYTINSGTYVSLLTNVILWGNATVSQQSKVTVNGSLNVGNFVFSCTTSTSNFIVNAGGTIITSNVNGLTTSIPTTNIAQTFDAGANYEFVTSTAAQTANFPAAVTTMNNLTINNGAFNVKTNKSITVNGNLTFTSGNLDLNGSFNITLGTSGNIVTESNTSRLINSGSPSATNGYIGTTRTLGANPGNIANIGLDISDASAMGSTVIKRFPKVVSSISTSLSSISRVYSIQPTTASATSTIKLNYFDGELGGNTETAPGMVTFNSITGNETNGANYSYVGANATDAMVNTVTKNTVNLSTTNTFWTCLNTGKYETAANGDWNTGSTWVGGNVPPTNANVTIKHDVTVSTADTNTVNGLTIDSGKSLTVSPLYDLTVTDAIVNNGTLTIENNGNLLQTNNVSNSGSGSTVVKRNSSLLKRLDYTLWSSPVTGQGVYAFSKFTLPNRFYVYDTANDNYNNSMVGLSLTGLQYPTGSGLISPNGVDGTDTANVQFENGKGYLIRVPYNHPTTPTVYNGIFTGVANNGNISASVSTSANGYNAVGNPYPSRLNVWDFIDGNSNITGPLYFWRKTNTTATSTSYATLTKTAYVANGSAGGDTGTGFFPTGGGQEANWVLNVGQGFIVKATSGSAISFTNSMRRSSNADQFFKDATTVNTLNNGLYWLNLTDNTGVYSQMAVGYSAEGTIGFDRGIDGENINREFYLTSLIDAGEYSVQGRPEFDSADIVPLSYKALTSGNYAIAIDHTAGLFTDVSQPIYVKDNVTSTYHDLNTGAYSFATEAGTFNDRFEIVYALPLGIDNPTFTANNVIVYNQNNELIITTGSVIMASVKIFDIRGRLLNERKGINANQTSMNAGLANEVLLVQITTEDGIVVTKKVIR